jgi:hypothetical protein
MKDVLVKQPHRVSSRGYWRCMFFLASLVVIASCSTSPGVTSQPPSLSDLAFVDTLREFDERAERLFGNAKFDASTPELKKFGDVTVHQHEKRTDDLVSWRKTYFPDEAKRNSPDTPCMQRQYGLSSSQGAASDVAIIDDFLAHRRCGTEWLSRQLPSLQHAPTKTLGNDVLRDYEADILSLTQLRVIAPK